MSCSHSNTVLCVHDTLLMQLRFKNELGFVATNPPKAEYNDDNEDEFDEEKSISSIFDDFLSFNLILIFLFKIFFF